MQIQVAAEQNSMVPGAPLLVASDLQGLLLNMADMEKVDFCPQANFKIEKCPQIHVVPSHIKDT